MSEYAQWMFDQLRWRDAETLSHEWADQDKVLRLMAGKILSGEYLGA